MIFHFLNLYRAWLIYFIYNLIIVKYLKYSKCNPCVLNNELNIENIHIENQQKTKYLKKREMIKRAGNSTSPCCN